MLFPTQTWTAKQTLLFSGALTSIVLTLYTYFVLDAVVAYTLITHFHIFGLHSPTTSHLLSTVQSGSGGILGGKH